MAKRTPVVFVSSTAEDLKAYRDAARDAAIQYEFQPVMMEYFAAQGAKPPYAACMAKVEECDVLVVIVAHRYGWTPPDQPPPGGKSITWLECEKALADGKEVLAFLVDEKHPSWPPELKETYRLTQAIEEGRYTAELGEEVNRNTAKLKEFKAWLKGLGFRATFTNTGDLKAGIQPALHEWLKRHPEFGAPPAEVKNDPTEYRRWLREETAWIDIRGLQVGTGKAYRFPIEDLYIPLTTAASVEGREAGKEMREAVPLEEALRHRKLVISGDAGSGKTTFLRRIASEMCRDGGTMKLPYQGFPILVRIAELEQHIKNCHAAKVAGAPARKEAPAWLAHHLEEQSQDLKWNLDGAFFERKLEEESTVVLLDGLDEAPGRVERESMARLFESATGVYRKCRFVVTTRPQAYTGRATLAEFHEVRIDDLGVPAIERFLEHWARCLYPENPSGAESHRAALAEALHARPEIRRMARNPVMLTALAVVHWNERRLPEQRADLYESILTWLARSRETREGREPADRCLELLGHLALGMQDRAGGRVPQISKGQGAEAIAAQFRSVAEEDRLGEAQSFLDEEEVDSGIVVSRGTDVRFWHLTFQEFLAGRTIAGLAERAQQGLLVESGKLYQPEWREVLLLLAGILRVKQGTEKVDGLFRAVLDRLGRNAPLAEQARGAGLLGAIVRDLEPFKYRPADPRYQELMDGVLGIFDWKKARGIELNVRLEAAEALGQAGDPRLRRPQDSDYWVMIPAGTFRMGAQRKDAAAPNYDSGAFRDEYPVHEVELALFSHAGSSKKPPFLA